MNVSNENRSIGAKTDSATERNDSRNAGMSKDNIETSASESVTTECQTSPSSTSTTSKETDIHEKKKRSTEKQRKNNCRRVPTFYLYDHVRKCVANDNATVPEFEGSVLAGSRMQIIADLVAGQHQADLRGSLPEETLDCLGRGLEAMLVEMEPSDRVHAYDLYVATLKNPERRGAIDAVFLNWLFTESFEAEMDFILRLGKVAA